MTRTTRADVDVIRAARLDSLGVLLTRIANGVRLTADEARLLMDHVDVEVRESTTAREVARGNLRHVQLIVPELERAEAAITRVLGILADPLLATTDPERAGERYLARQIRAALDDPKE
jgi:hypothetical protein